MSEENITPKEPAKIEASPSLAQSHHGHLGLILGLLVLLLALVLIGLYLWGMERQAAREVIEVPIVNNEPETPRAKVDTQILETTSPSDDLAAIKADLGSTALDSVEADLTAIDAELNTAIPQ